jgi:hypothetical protein
VTKTLTLFGSLLIAALGSCKSTDAPTPNPSLEGTWRLTHRQCYCIPEPLPDETVTFTSDRFTFYKGNRATRLGRHSFTTASPLCLIKGAPVPVLRLTTERQFPDSTANAYSTNAQYRLDGDTLTLDYGGPCDAPVDTYERL